MILHTTVSRYHVILPSLSHDEGMLLFMVVILKFSGDFEKKIILIEWFLFYLYIPKG